MVSFAASSFNISFIKMTFMLGAKTFIMLQISLHFAQISDRTYFNQLFYHFANLNTFCTNFRQNIFQSSFFHHFANLNTFCTNFRQNIFQSNDKIVSCRHRTTFFYQIFIHSKNFSKILKLIRHFEQHFLQINSHSLFLSGPEFLFEMNPASSGSKITVEFFPFPFELSLSDSS